ncbi:hypothetical protein ACIQ9K_27170 [Streptomyces microflavus]|uniref:hypothetical protein n=1 Tax=Streptomyces microflavus TaxID=1919 RepID=UPI0038151C37
MVALVALLSLLVMPVPEARGTAATQEPSAATEDQRALDRAEETGSRVEVEGQRSEYATVYANPDGVTFTLEQSVTPVRVAKAAGGWQEPDATLERRSDGTVGPKAAAVSISLSGGGDGALAKIGKAGRSLELEWPQDLPVPRIDGASAVYDDVLPDVDLKVTATVASFQQVLIVKTPEAAGDPRLKKLTLGMKTAGLDVRRGGAGNLTAVDGDGRTVFRAPPAQMWDSAGAAAAPGSAASNRGAGAAASQRTGVTGGRAEPAASGSGLEPGDLDHQVLVHGEHVVRDLRLAAATPPEADPDLERRTSAHRHPLRLTRPGPPDAE